MRLTLCLVCSLFFLPVEIGALATPAQAEETSLGRAAPMTQNSPLAIEQGFLVAAGRVAKAVILQKQGHALTATQVTEAADYLDRAGEVLDLSGTPPILAGQVRLERTLQLYEVLRRVPVEVLAKGPYEIAPGRWVIPGTPLDIRRLEAGPARGAFRFSAETLAKLDDTYERAKSVPPLWGGVEQVYDDFRDTPGQLVIPGWFDLVRKLPSVVRADIAGQAIWQWLTLAATVVAAILLCAGALVVSRRIDRASIIGQLAAVAILPIAVRIAAFTTLRIVSEINLVDTHFVVIDYLCMAIAYGAWIWFLWVMLLWLSEHLPRYLHRTHVVPISLSKMLIRMIGCIGIAMVLGHGLAEIGVPFVGIIAGLGVGGLALALAAQPTIENLISGIILYIDKPVRVGDICEFDGLLGTVEEIGIRSTRVRLNDGILITMPNATFANQVIRNTCILEPNFGFRFPLDTRIAPDRLATLLQNVRARLESDQDIRPRSARAYVVSMSGGAIEIETYGHFVDHGKDLEERRCDLRIALLQVIRDAGGLLASAPRAVLNVPPGPEALESEPVEGAASDAEPQD